MRKLYSSDAIDVSFDPAKCIHAARCVAGSPEVFRPGERPWVQPQNSSADEIARTVAECPTGALRYERRDGGPPETGPRRAHPDDREGRAALRPRSAAPQRRRRQ